MDVRLWGNQAWDFLHAVTFNYPDSPTAEQMRDHREFFELVARVLPCETCRRHFREELHEKRPVVDWLASRDQLSRWLCDVHNDVNRRTNKPIIPYTAVKAKFDAMRGTCRTDCAEDAIAAATAQRCTTFSPLVYGVAAWAAITILVLIVVALLLLRRRKC